jgi:hypothetical protein
MKRCAVCSQEIQDEATECGFCKEAREKISPVAPFPAPVLKRFKGFATQRGKKFSGVFEARDEQDARQRLVDQGFEFIEIEPERVEAPEKRHSTPGWLREILFVCRSQPIILTVPLVLIFLSVSTCFKAKEAIRNKASASIKELTFPQPGDRVYLKQGYFMTDDKKIFNTALNYQRSGNIAALKNLFSGRPMVVSKEGMVVRYEGREGLIPRAAKVSFQNSKDILYLDYEGINLERSVLEAAKGPVKEPEENRENIPQPPSAIPSE